MDRDREQRWADLLRRARGGDTAASTRFLAEIAPVLRRVIEARGGGRPDEVDDILQTSLAAIHEMRHTWREDAPVSRWIYAIARHKAVDAARRRRRRPATTAFDGADLPVADEAVPDATVARDLDRLLSGLDATSETIVRDLRLQGLTAEETGRHVGLSPGAVRVRLHRALARLSASALARPGPPGAAAPRAARPGAPDAGPGAAVTNGLRIGPDRTLSADKVPAALGRRRAAAGPPDAVARRWQGASAKLRRDRAGRAGGPGSAAGGGVDAP